MSDITILKIRWEAFAIVLFFLFIIGLLICVGGYYMFTNDPHSAIAGLGGALLGENFIVLIIFVGYFFTDGKSDWMTVYTVKGDVKK